MRRQIIKQGEAVSFAFFNVKIPLDENDWYEITEHDKVVFTIGRRNRKPIIVKEYPKDIVNRGENTFVIQLTPKETAKLPCLLYQMNLTIDISGLTKEIYTLITQELEVISK